MTGAPRAIASALVFGCALAFAGCTQAQVENAGREVASAAPALANDGLVVAQIEAAFVRIDPDSALHVAVASHDGRVRLSGRARSAMSVAKFVAAAKGTAGVRDVTSTVVADPTVPSTKKAVVDFALAAAVRANLAAQAGVNALGIGIAASDGTIVLRGHAKTSALRATLIAAARATAGVHRVDDRLVVSP